MTDEDLKLIFMAACEEAGLHPESYARAAGVHEWRKYASAKTDDEAEAQFRRIIARYSDTAEHYRLVRLHGDTWGYADGAPLTARVIEMVHGDAYRTVIDQTETTITFETINPDISTRRT